MKNFLCKQLKHTKFITALSLFLLHSAAYSAVTINGYWNAGTINGVSFPANGTGAQLTSPTLNPAIFCQLQGAGWRLPNVEEVNLSYLGKKPLTNTTSTTNGAHTIRRVGSLVSEWGGRPGLNPNSKWLDGTIYWVNLPANATQTHGIHLGSVDNGDLRIVNVTNLAPPPCVITL
ncbi:hypothetical protein [Thorsellia anophelis]|uniref:DUF1566 domain-containing protein n=1 Tax=Thorsellia anophelis DSM 18579 TaxID=1123402 RepID=A0A1H9YFQ3_9GAMM|nr:hypothetical protein [Thorsellia anophelis]SES67859.1 hypothetical protein SAMN02583745_00241 [Thorsellia anophelis DSM 18579]